MADESDGIEEAFEGQLRIAVTAAGRVGEAFARGREEAARRAQAQSEQAARELSSRFEAEKRAARVELGGVYRSDWWDKATPQQIGGALTTARAWGTEDPEAQRAEGRIRDELRTRYGVDVDNTGADPAAVQAAVDDALQPGPLVHRELDAARDDGRALRPAGEQRDERELVHRQRHLVRRDDRRAERARGDVEVGDRFEFVSRLPDAVSCAFVSRIMNVERGDLAAMRELLEAPEFPERWRKQLLRRLGKSA